MTEREALEQTVRYLVHNAEEALASAEGERKAGRHRFAMNRIYYACFYSASAGMHVEGRHFVRHSGLRAALHREWVRTGRLDATWGGFYDEMFDARQTADYGMFVEFDDETVARSLERGRGFVSEIKRMLTDRGYPTAE